MSSTRYFRLSDIAGKDSVLSLNQYQYAPGKEQNYTLNLAYTQVLTKESRLQVSYGFNANKEHLNSNTYNLGAPDDKNIPIGILPEGYEAGNIDSLANRSNSLTSGHNLALQFTYNGEVWGIRSSLTTTFQKRSINEYTGRHQADTTINSIEWQPNLTLTYHKGDNYAMISYNGGTSQPMLRDLIAPTDYSSPLNITTRTFVLRIVTIYMQCSITSVKGLWWE